MNVFNPDYEAGLRDGRTAGRVYGHSFSPGWTTSQARYDAYRAGYTAGREILFGKK